MCVLQEMTLFLLTGTACPAAANAQPARLRRKFRPVVGLVLSKGFGNFKCYLTYLGGRAGFAGQSPPAMGSIESMATATITRVAQPIAGVTPAEIQEATIMTVWPSVAQYALGRALGSLYAIRWPDVYFFRLGNLIALLAIPVALVLFFMRIAPGIGTRYRLTNRRIIVERGLSGVEDRWVDLDRFDAIDIEVRPGQQWYDAGDLVFRLGNVETFRLPGVSRPAAFRETCLKAHLARVTISRTRPAR